MSLRPEKCGLCERFFENYCIPIKEKYGYEFVYENQKPSVNCPYESGKCPKCDALIVKGNCVECYGDMIGNDRR